MSNCKAPAKENEDARNKEKNVCEKDFPDVCGRNTPRLYIDFVLFSARFIFWE